MNTEGYEAGAVELAKGGLSALVTTALGVLVGVFAYAGQHPPTGDARCALICAVISAGTALLLALLSFLVAYATQLQLAMSKPNIVPWWWAFSLFLVALLCLLFGMIAAGCMLWLG